MSLNSRDGYGRWEAECHRCSKILNLRTRNISTACERVIASGWAVDVTDDGDFVYLPGLHGSILFCPSYDTAKSASSVARLARPA